MKNAIKTLVAVMLISAFAVTAFASAFVPSVAQKAAPVVVANPDGTVAAVVIAPAASEEASEAAKAAYEALVELGSIEKIDESLAGKVITDVFEVTTEVEIAEGEAVVVSIEVEVEEGQTITVLFYNGTEWVVVPEEFVSFENGVLSITMTEVGVFALAIG